MEDGREFEVNNQLGLERIFDEETQALGLSGQMTGERGQESQCQPEGDTLDRIFALLVATNQEIKENNQKINETNQKADEINRELKETRQEVKDNQKQNQEAYKQLEGRIQQWEERFGSRMETMERMHVEMKEDIKINTLEMQQIKKNVVEELQKQENKMNDKIKESGEGLSRQIGEFSEENRRTAEELRKRMNQQKQETKKALVSIEESVNDIRKTTDNKITLVTEKENANLKEMNQRMERIQQRLNETENRTIIRCGGDATQKELKYDGSNPYPMEFIRELTEHKNKLYNDAEVSWIANHLEKDAGIWWRIIREKVRCFDDFLELFTEKYWSSEIQGLIRDDMEFGRYKPYNVLSSTQYVERKVLEYQQITPRIPEKLLVKKLAKHFGREIQVAVVTRGVDDVNRLVSILHEFEHLYRKPMVETPKGLVEKGRFEYKPKYVQQAEKNVDCPPFRQQNKWEKERPVVNQNYRHQQSDVKPVSVVAMSEQPSTSKQTTQAEAGIKKNV